eukprot:TRINITY_DN51869_c0_g1_i1.p1 TRINITY_DN51869_c0_g1~~TRINITY_DN51869_c0_g1_i1.p1  ORF type:complete len:152 (+),score=8.96 TRINITY_DN51869_c0_g1_i1:3-458(+)
MIHDARCNPVIKLIDFGASRTIEFEDGLMWTRVGFYQYVAPEVLTGAGYRKSCDLWSLGCTFFAFCTREFPFEAANERSMIKLVHEKRAAPKWNAKLWPDYDRRLKNVVSKLLQYDPHRRPPAAKIMQEQSWLRDKSSRDQSTQQGCCSVQ